MVKHDKNGKPVAEYEGEQRFFDDIPFTLIKTKKGGSGSGNFGHEGRPGEVGGSGEGGGSNSGNFAVEIPTTIDGLNSFIEEHGLADTGYFEEGINEKVAADVVGAVNTTMNREDLNYIPDKLLLLGNEDLGKSTIMEVDSGKMPSMYINTNVSGVQLKLESMHGSAAIEAGGHPFAASGYFDRDKQMQTIVNHEFGHIVLNKVGEEKYR